MLTPLIAESSSRAKSQEEPLKPGGKGFATLLVSPEFRVFYVMTLGMLLLVAAALLFVGLRYVFFFYHEAIGSGILYTIGGLLAFLAAVFLRQLHRYYSRTAKLEIDPGTKAPSTALKEDDFEEFERVQRLRQEKERRDFERNLEATIAVERLEAREALLFPKLAWDLQPGVNVLLGRNGYGKSVVLRAIAGLLQRNEEVTQQLLLKKIGSSDSIIEIRLKRDGEEVYVRRKAERFVESIGKVPLLAIPDSRFFDRSQQVVGPDDSDTADLRVYGAHHFLHQKPYGSVIQALLYEICLDYWEHGRDFDRPVFEFLGKCVHDLTGYDFRFVSIERRGRTGFEIRVLTEGNADPLPIQFASQGTLSVLGMFGLIRSYLRAKSGESKQTLGHGGSAIIIIDEADAHLHPVWQQKVPGLLKELFPKVQFILSAHSPLFVAGCWRKEVAVLRRSNADSPGDGFTIVQPDHDFVGATSAELYKEIFEIEEADRIYLQYAMKSTLRADNSKRINELSERREGKGLSPTEEEEYRKLMEESRRIRRAVEVSEQRRVEGGKDLRIAELESETLKLKTQLAQGATETKS